MTHFILYSVITTVKTLGTFDRRKSLKCVGMVFMFVSVPVNLHTLNKMLHSFHCRAFRLLTAAVSVHCRTQLEQRRSATRRRRPHSSPSQLVCLPLVTLSNELQDYLQDFWRKLRFLLDQGNIVHLNEIGTVVLFCYVHE